MKVGANPNEQARIRAYVDDKVSVQKISQIMQIDEKVVRSFAHAHTESGVTEDKKSHSAEELISQIAESEDAEFLESMTKDKRVTVAEAANKRIKELDDQGGL